MHWQVRRENERRSRQTVLSIFTRHSIAHATPSSSRVDYYESSRRCVIWPLNCVNPRFKKAQRFTLSAFQVRRICFEGVNDTSSLPMESCNFTRKSQSVHNADARNGTSRQLASQLRGPGIDKQNVCPYYIPMTHTSRPPPPSNRRVASRRIRVPIPSHQRRTSVLF